MSFIKKCKWEILILLFVIITRMPDLGDDMFNTDVWKWKSRAYDFSTGVFTLDFEKTIQKYHPGVTLMWIGTVGIKLFNFYHKVIIGVPAADNVIQNVFTLHLVQKFLIVLVIGTLMSFIFFPLKKMFGLRYALISVFLMSTEPFYLALTRIMHLEGLMSTFMLASFVWLMYYVFENGKKSMLLSSLFAAGAFLTKTSSLFLIPFVGLVLLVENMKKRKGFGESLLPTIKKYGRWLGLSILFFVVLWPAMYTHAPLALKTLYRGILTIGIERDHPQLFLGKWVDDPGTFYYIVVFVFRSSWWLLIGLLCFAGMYRKLDLDNKKKAFILYALLFVLLYIIELTIPAKKLDRYILPSLIMCVLIASFFFEHLLGRLTKRYKFGKEIFLVLLITPVLSTALYLHPYYFSYYSPWLGGLQKGIYAMEPKWMIGQHEIVEYFQNELQKGELELYAPEESLDSQLNKASINNKLTIGFQEKYYTQIWPFIERLGGRATIKDITIHAQNSNYFVYPVYDNDSHLEDRVEISRVGVVQLRGVDMYYIYKRID